MAANREMAKAKIKVNESLPSFPAATPIDVPDPQASCDRRSSSTASPERPDPATSVGATKRPRDLSSRLCSGSSCRKWVGLIGFRCRCGDVFCSEHRHSDRHDCSYDYKAVGGEAIARENPVVRAAKLVKV